MKIIAMLKSLVLLAVVLFSATGFTADCNSPDLSAQNACFRKIATDGIGQLQSLIDKAKAKAFAAGAENASETLKSESLAVQVALTEVEKGLSSINGLCVLRYNGEVLDQAVLSQELQCELEQELTYQIEINSAILHLQGK